MVNFLKDKTDELYDYMQDQIRKNNEVPGLTLKPSVSVSEYRMGVGTYDSLLVRRLIQDKNDVLVAGLLYSSTDSVMDLKSRSYQKLGSSQIEEIRKNILKGILDNGERIKKYKLSHNS